MNILSKRRRLTSRLTALFLLILSLSSLPAQKFPDDPLILWLKADAGVECDAEGRIQAWKDQSGNQRDAIQNDESHRPMYDSNGQNGLPTAQFQKESGLFLETPAVVLPRTYSVFLVLDIKKIQFSVALSQVGLTGDDVNAAGLVVGSAPDRTTNGVAARTSEGDANSAWETTELQWLGIGPSIVTLLMEGDQKFPSVQYFLNGEPAGASGGSFGTSFDQPLIIGGVAAGWPSLGGDISEVVIFEGVLDQENRKKVEAALSEKYGISVAH